MFSILSTRENEGKSKLKTDISDMWGAKSAQAKKAKWQKKHKIGNFSTGFQKSPKRGRIGHF